MIISTQDLSSNEKRVLDLIWRDGPIARQDIASAIGLTAASITRLTKQLDEYGLIVSSFEKTGSRGNQKQPVSINPDGALSLGVSFSHTFLEVGLMNLGGTLIGTVRTPLERADIKNIAQASKKGVNALLRRHDAAKDKVIGIGFALPGDFSATPPYLQAHAYFPSLAGVDILSELIEQFEFPCFVENDCNTAAFGERVLGMGKQHSTFLSVFLGHGIGSGLIVDGELMRGVNGNAGAIGYMYPMDQPRPSGQDFFETIQAADQEIYDFSDLDELDLDGNDAIKNWIERAGAQLCNGLSVAARLFDPDAIVIGGRVPPYFLEALTEAIDYDLFCADGAPLTKPAIKPSRLGGSAGVIGAAALPIYHSYLKIGSTNSRDNYVNGRR